MDRAKEGLFNILANQFSLEGVRVVDLFSGSGAIAFEFASRGAGYALCVESNASHAREISRNARALGFPQVEVRKLPVLRYLKEADSFPLVFADPPYAMPGMGELPRRVLEAGVVAAGGLLILEHAPAQPFVGIEPQQRRRYGDAEFSFFWQKG